MKLTTTRNLIIKHDIFWDIRDECLKRFDQAYPNIDPDQEVSLLDMLNNGYNTEEDIRWVLRATKQDSSYVADTYSTKYLEFVFDASGSIHFDERQTLIELLE